MGFKRFAFHISLRVALLGGTLLVLVWVSSQFIYPTLSLIFLLAVIAQLSEALRFVSKTNAELTRFLEAARYSDFSQRFQMKNEGAGFDELGSALSEIMERFRLSRQAQEQELRHLRALVEHVPVPLMSLQNDGEINLHNNAARRLFGNTRVARLEDLDQFGQDFMSDIKNLPPGNRHLVNFVTDDVEKQLSVASTQISLGHQVEKLISLQDIQSELDGAQLKAWQDLVRVLTHEIMNSITPVASLAKTTTDLVEDATEQVKALEAIAGVDKVLEELVDIKSAVDTVARRSDSLMNFVQSYRRLTRLPAPKKGVLRLKQVFSQVARLVSAEWQAQGITLSTHVEPESLSIEVDGDMIEQVLINLLRNAEQALAGSSAATVKVFARINRRGHVVLEIIDNGPGIAEDILEKVFVPFFTTKREGSGVGLALTRQVMIAHGGSVSLGAGDKNASGGRGVRIALTF